MRRPTIAPAATDPSRHAAEAADPASEATDHAGTQHEHTASGAGHGEPGPAEHARAEARTSEDGAAVTHHAGLALQHDSGADSVKIVVDHLELPPTLDHRYVYAEPRTEDDRPIPVYDGEPVPDQALQGRLQDCGPIAVIRAVARKVSGAIRAAVTEHDGTVLVRLHEVRMLDDGRAEPTGRIIEETVKPELPTDAKDPRRPAFANVRRAGAAWAGLLEKGIAGVDRTWSDERIAQNQEIFWRVRAGSDWRGYARLDIGSTPEMHAELLTMLTGEPARTVTASTGAERAEIWKRLLDEGKPVIGSSVRELSFKPPHRLTLDHVYEIVGVEEGPGGIADGRVFLSSPTGRLHPDPIPVSEVETLLDPDVATLDSLPRPDGGTGGEPQVPHALGGNPSGPARARHAAGPEPSDEARTPAHGAADPRTPRHLLAGLGRLTGHSPAAVHSGPPDEVPPAAHRPDMARPGSLAAGLSDPRSAGAIDIPNLELPSSRHGYVFAEATTLDGELIPVFNGEPTPDQAMLGDLNACHVMVAIRAAARISSASIRDMMSENGDGTVTVRLHETSLSADGRSAAPTGRLTELRMSTRLPAGRVDPGRPVFANVRRAGVTWAGLLQKGLAGVDRSWTSERIAINAELFRQHQEMAAARGYARLDAGGNAQQVAEVLTQLTGEQARVFVWRNGAEAATLWRRLLIAGKPVITATRSEAVLGLGYARRYAAAFDHNYEIISISDGQRGIEDGSVILSNPTGMIHPYPIPVSDLGKVLEPWIVTLHTPRSERGLR